MSNDEDKYTMIVFWSFAGPVCVIALLALAASIYIDVKGLREPKEQLETTK